MKPAQIDLCAGSGGWDEGARLLGLDECSLGVELDERACSAAIQAGHRRHRADIRDLDPTTLHGVRGLRVSTPCPTFAACGLGTGRGHDQDLLFDVITCAGAGCGCSWDDRRHALAAISDPRTALAAETIRFALLMPDLQWLAVEQVPAAEPMFESIAAELLSFDDGTGEGGYGPGWEAADVLTVDAAALGNPARRRRVFLVARRYQPLGGPGVDDPRMVREPARSMASALGWAPGERVRTRGARRTSGGNCFSADEPSWCLTEKARSWTRESDGRRLTSGEAGLLNGFRADYPWSGSRTAQFHQAGDVVVPVAAAAVLGYVTGTPWLPAVRAYLADLHGDLERLHASTTAA